MIFDILGWIGMILVLVAYGLLSTNKVENGKLYQMLNHFLNFMICIKTDNLMLFPMLQRLCGTKKQK